MHVMQDHKGSCIIIRLPFYVDMQYGTYSLWQDGGAACRPDCRLMRSYDIQVDARAGAGWPAAAAGSAQPRGGGDAPLSPSTSDRWSPPRRRARG